MPDYLMLMHNDASRVASDSDWAAYIAALGKTGKLRGGGGVSRRKSGAAPAITAHLDGFIRVEAESLADAEALLAGNPVFENGGTVEIRELPKTG
jgi:hypothetical protein